MKTLIPIERIESRILLIRGGRRCRPFVFTEHGAVMLSNVLNTQVAVQASILIARAFVKLRRLIAPPSKTRSAS